MATSPSSAPLVLRPGTPVLRRDSTTLQVGLDPPHLARLPDLPGVRTLLDRLRTGLPVPAGTPEADRALARLHAAGLVLPRGPAGGDPSLTAAQAQFGADAVRRRADREALPVAVRAATPARTVALDLLAAAGARIDDTAPALWLVVGDGPLARESLDPLVRTGTPHLVVSGDSARRRVGPLVEPGRTACLRCVDAHEAEDDPRRPFLLEQAAMTCTGPAPQDPVLDRLALAWAVRDVCRYLEGDQPSTWSSTVDIDPLGVPATRSWLRHPHCGCCWDQVRELP